MRPIRDLAVLIFISAFLIAGCGGSGEQPNESQAPPRSGNGAVTISWLAPSQTQEGMPLTDLAGFRVRYGTKYGTYPDSVDVHNGGTTTYVLRGLAPGLYYFVVMAVNQRGLESPPSRAARIQVY